MNPQYIGEMLKHLDKQKETLEDAHKLMTHELEKLLVEQEMLMRKFYELMNRHRHKKNQDNNNVSDNGVAGHCTALASTNNNDQH